VHSIFMGYIAPAAVLAPIAVALYKARYLSRPEKIIMGYLLLAGSFNLLAKLTAHRNNLPLLHLYTVLEFSVLNLFFRSLSADHRYRKALLALLIAFAAVAVAYVLLSHTLFVYNALPRFLSSMILTFLCIRFMALRLGYKPDASPSPHSRFNFIAVTAMLLYFSCCSTLFALSNYFMRHNNDLGIDTLIWNIHAVFMAAMYLIFAVAYLIVRKE
jgi:hypothetical protein